MEKRVSVKRLALVSFLAQFAIVKFNFTLVYYLQSLSFSSSEIGFFTSISPVVYLLGCLFLPGIFKRMDGKARVLISLAGMALSILLFSAAGKGIQFSLVLLLYGFFQSLLWTNTETWMTSCREGRENLTLTLTLFNFSWSSSVAVANLIGGFLVSVSYTLSFAVEVSAFLLALLVVFTVPYNICEGEKDGKTDDDNSSLSPYRYLSWLGIFIIYTGYSMVIVVFPQYALSSLSFSSLVSGRLLFCRGLSVCIAFLVLKRFTFWQKGKKAVVLMLLSFTVLTMLFGVVEDEFLFYPVFILYGFVFALGYDLSIFHSAEGGGRRHMRMVIHEVLITLGTSSGSFFGSLIYDSFSFSTLVCAVTIIGAVSVVIAILSKTKAIAERSPIQ